jgi:hypothetical protein
VGGKRRGKGGGYKGNKTAVLTMVERDGRAHSHVMPEVQVKRANGREGIGGSHFARRRAEHG